MAEIEFRYLGVTEYQEAWDLQKQIVKETIEARESGESIPMKVLFVEHPHVYTMGAYGDDINILFGEEFLKRVDAKFFRIERGGDITYHGFGQLVCYPVLDLERLKIGVKQYVNILEEAVICTLGHYGIVGRRLESSTGVWLGVGSSKVRKICAIGIKVTRFVTMHGFALNVTTNLDYFNYINPCGFTDKEVTSIAKETSLQPSLTEVAEEVAVHLKRVLAIN